MNDHNVNFLNSDISKAIFEEVLEEVRNVGQNDCIEKVERLTTWIDPITVISKHNVIICMCLDMRRANEV